MFGFSGGGRMEDEWSFGDGSRCDSITQQKFFKLTNSKGNYRYRTCNPGIIIGRRSQMLPSGQTNAVVCGNVVHLRTSLMNGSMAANFPLGHRIGCWALFSASSSSVSGGSRLVRGRSGMQSNVARIVIIIVWIDLLMKSFW